MTHFFKTNSWRRKFCTASVCAVSFLGLLANFNLFSPLVLAQDDDVPVEQVNVAEAQITKALKDKPDKLQVVHFWAPWCPNCKVEFKSDEGNPEAGWTAFVKKHPEVQFYFVTMWNNGNDGKADLEKAGLAYLPNVIITADRGPMANEDRTHKFLGLPITWIPSTWVFKNQQLYFALNYGEIRFPVLEQLVQDSTSKWKH